jgi:DNA-binding PadR family transcriptional regulator
MHESREMFRQIIDTLKENGSIVAEEAESGGRKPLVCYRLT